jgi:hypothetical protein
MASTKDDKTGLEAVRDAQSLDMLERIFYYEQLAPVQADNDNATARATSRQQASACFDSWALPDYLRR